MYTTIFDNTYNNNLPIIYKIEIGLSHEPDYMFYIGKASKGTSRPLKTYPKCVRNYENKIYRKTYKNGQIVGKRPSWRPHVHIPLYEAFRLNKSITLTMINVSLKDLNTIEKSMISELVSVHGKEKTMNKEFVK